MTKETLWLNDWDSEKLKKVRLDLRLRQKDFAKLMDVHPITLSYIELDKGGALSTIDLYGILMERAYAHTNFMAPVYVRESMVSHMKEYKDVYGALTPQELYARIMRDEGFET